MNPKNYSHGLGPTRMKQNRTDDPTMCAYFVADFWDTWQPLKPAPRISKSTHITVTDFNISLTSLQFLQFYSNIRLHSFVSTRHVFGPNIRVRAEHSGSQSLIMSNMIGVRWGLDWQPNIRTLRGSWPPTEAFSGRESKTLNGAWLLSETLSGRRNIQTVRGSWSPTDSEALSGWESKTLNGAWLLSEALSDSNKSGPYVLRDPLLRPWVAGSQRSGLLVATYIW